MEQDKIIETNTELENAENRLAWRIMWGTIEWGGDNEEGHAERLADQVSAWRASGISEYLILQNLYGFVAEISRDIEQADIDGDTYVEFDGSISVVTEKVLVLTDAYNQRQSEDEAEEKDLARYLLHGDGDGDSVESRHDQCDWLRECRKEGMSDQEIEASLAGYVKTCLSAWQLLEKPDDENGVDDSDVFLYRDFAGNIHNVAAQLLELTQDWIEESDDDDDDDDDDDEK